MQDRQYREAIAWQNVAYNQPPHPSFFIGKSMLIPENLRPPSTPNNIRGVPSEDSVLIEWDANVDSDLAGYILYRGKSKDNLADSIDVGNVTSYIDTNVVNDTTYYYAVAAYDLDGNISGHSDIIEVTPTVRPDSPTGISSRFDSDSIFLIWESQNLENISKINVYRSETEDMASVKTTTIDKSLNTYTDKNLTTGKTYYYALSVTDVNQVESFKSDVLSITPGNSFTFQAEDAAIIGTVFLDNNHLGYHGTAFANFDVNNSSVEFTNMPGFGGGKRVILFRYALGNTDRTGSLVVNDDSRSLTMRGTGDWTNYVIDSVEVNLTAGFYNTIQFSATGSDFGNLDEITIVPRSITAVELSDDLPTEFQLHQNYPNPFNPTTMINYSVPVSVFVQLKIYDLLGKEIVTLVNEQKSPGNYNVEFNANRLPSGIYFYQISAGDFISTKKMLLMK